MKVFAQYLEQSPWGSVVPSILEKGVGGRETAVLNISKSLASLGHRVINFVPTEQAVYVSHKSGGVEEFHSVEHLIGGCVTAKPDMLITWENPLPATITDLADSCKKVVMGMQVAHVSEQPDFKKALKSLDAIVCLSNYATRVFKKDNDGLCDGVDFTVIPNGVDIKKFVYRKKNVLSGKSKRPTAIYSSSPDRGLVWFTEIWPLVLEKEPKAKLHVCYGAEKWIVETVKSSHSKQCEDAVKIAKFLGIDPVSGERNAPSYKGVVYHGKVGQSELRKLMSKSQILAYPTDTIQPTETGCITVVEALASFTHPIIGNCDCLPEDFGDVSTVIDLPMNPQEYADAMVDGFHYRLDGMKEKIDRGFELAVDRDWSNVAKKYVELCGE